MNKLLEAVGSGNKQTPQPSDAPYCQVLPCIHCGEATECSLTQSPEAVFCCRGCRGAYELIHGWGLENFYALRDQMKFSGNARPASQRERYEQFDTPEFLGKSTPVQNSDGTCSATLAVHGLHCGACAWLIETAVAHEAGLLSARVQMSQHTIRLIFDSAETRLSNIAKFLDRLGYQLSPFDASHDEHIQTESRRLLIQIAIAGFLAANAMWIAIALYAGEATGVAAEHRYFLGIIGTLLGVAAVALPGRTFFVGAVASVKHKTPHMDLPVALGLLVGSIVGTVNAVRGMGHVYFDSLSTLVFLLLVGRWIQFRQQQSAMRAVDLMLRITPRHANRVKENGETKMVQVDVLSAGDVIRVAPGDSIPADGHIVVGETRLDRSLLSGESMPVPANMGDEVAAGTLNLVAPIDICVSAVGRESRIGRVMQAVEHAAAERTPVVLLADRIGGYFVVAVMILAICTLVGWLGVGLAEATSNATSLLIVACPCALALATPLAIAVGLGRAAKNGILIRDGRSLQLLSKPGRIWLDKTGTLTEGKQSVSSVLGSLDGLRLAAAIEAQCKHPVADAIVREARRRRQVMNSHEDSGNQAIVERVGRGGVIGRILENSQACRVCVGNLSFMQEQKVRIDATWVAEAQQLVHSGESPILIAIDDQVVTVLGISDRLRNEAQALVERLQDDRWKLGILSGDHPEIVQRVGKRLGIPLDQCLGGLSPEEKLAIVQSREGKQVVIMVGDGANDAAALATADVGIALRGGAEVSLQAAPIYLANGQLGSLIDLLQGSARTIRLIWATFAISLSYNLIAVAFAMLGWINPLIAAILMPLSSVSVLAITLGTKTFEKPTR